MTSEERYCHHMLAQIRRAYEREAKPYIDRLAQIKMMEVPRFVMVAPPMSSEDMAKLRARQQLDVLVSVGDVVAPVSAQDQSAPVDGGVP